MGQILVFLKAPRDNLDCNICYNNWLEFTKVLCQKIIIIIIMFLLYNTQVDYIFRYLSCCLNIIHNLSFLFIRLSPKISEENIIKCFCGFLKSKKNIIDIEYIALRDWESIK